MKQWEWEEERERGLNLVPAEAVYSLSLSLSLFLAVLVRASCSSSFLHPQLWAPRRDALPMGTSFCILSLPCSLSLSLSLSLFFSSHPGWSNKLTLLICKREARTCQVTSRVSSYSTLNSTRGPHVYFRTRRPLQFTQKWTRGGNSWA